MLPSKRPGFVAFVVAVVLVAISTILRLAFAQYLRQLLFFTYFPAVMAAGWFGGFWPGALATILSAVCVDCFLANQPFSFSFRSIDLIRLLVFTGCGLFISALNGLLHWLLRQESEAKEELLQAQETLSEHAAALEKTVAERTAQLRGHVAQLEEFSYTISHDLRSPLRAIQGYANAVLEDCGDKIGAEGKGYLLQVIKAAQRMDRLVVDMLAYSKVSRETISMEPVQLEGLIRGILDDYPAIKLATPEVIVRAPLLPVMGNESLLTQALSNLLGNAVKFVSAGRVPKIEIFSEDRGNKVRLSIKDNGIGVDPANQSRLFGLFERLDPNGPFEGTGVGLAIVRKSVERMGGTTGLESDGSTGSTFWVELPAGCRGSRIGPLG
jgi:signal transduction histidine kinase